MKRSFITFGTFALMATSVLAGPAIRPISNPVYSDLPDVGLRVHPIIMLHELPSTLNTELGDVPAGGDVQIYALQFEIPLGDDLSLIAVKDGYVDIDPDATLSKESGMADLAAGLKWVFTRGDTHAASARAAAIANRRSSATTR